MTVMPLESLTELGWRESGASTAQTGPAATAAASAAACAQMGAKTDMNITANAYDAKFDFKTASASLHFGCRVAALKVFDALPDPRNLVIKAESPGAFVRALRSVALDQGPSVEKFDRRARQESP